MYVKRKGESLQEEKYVTFELKISKKSKGTIKSSLQEGVRLEHYIEYL